MPSNTDERLPGLYHHLSNEDYHGGDGISKTHLDYAAKSAQHYKARMDRPQEGTEALRWGRIVHMAILEPGLWAESHVMTPKDAPRRPSITQRNAKNPSAKTVEAIKWWNDWNARTEGKFVISYDEAETLREMHEAVSSHPAASKLLAQTSSFELSAFAYDETTGELCRCRPDMVIDTGEYAVILDLKTCKDASPEGFAKSVANYRYHVQAAYYLDVMKWAGKQGKNKFDGPKEFVLLAIEKEYPYAVGIYTLDPEDVELGRALYERDLDRVSTAKVTKQYVGYTDKITQISLPRWAKGGIDD